MSNKFCVSIANCHQDPDKVTVGFVVANAAIGSEKETMVFLSTDGVWAAVKGEAEKISIGEPFAPLKDLIDKFGRRSTNAVSLQEVDFQIRSIRVWTDVLPLHVINSPTSYDARSTDFDQETLNRIGDDSCESNLDELETTIRR